MRRLLLRAAASGCALRAQATPAIDFDLAGDFTPSLDMDSASAAVTAAADAARASADAAAMGFSDEGVLSNLDLLCDDLFTCKTDVLKQFARTRGLAVGGSKAELVMQLIELAHTEAHGNSRDLRHTKRVLGNVFGNDEVRTSGVRAHWTNKSLEASHVEVACERYARLEQMSNNSKSMLVRRHVGEAARVLKRLTRPFQDDYEPTAAAAVGGVYRLFKEEVDQLVSRSTPAEVLAPFAAYLVATIRYSSSQNLLSRVDANLKLVQCGLARPTVEDGDITTLEGLMGLLDSVVEEVERRAVVFVESSPRVWGTDTPEVIHATTQAFVEANRHWELDEVPAWALDLARRFGSWEAIVRNDVPMFADVPAMVFHTIMLGVASLQVLRHIHEEAASPSDIPPGLRGAVGFALLQHFKDPDRANDALGKLLAYVQVGSAESTAAALGAATLGAVNRVGKVPSVKPEFFSAVLAQMQSASTDADARAIVMEASAAAASSSASAAGGGDAAAANGAAAGGGSNGTPVTTATLRGLAGDALITERVALVLREACATASRCQRSSGLFGLLVRLTEDMRFHLRFSGIFKLLESRDRDTIRERASLNMTKTLTYFEREFDVVPISTKAVGFLVIVLTYLASRGSGASSAVLERFTSVTGKAEFSLVGLAESEPTSIRDLKVALPPQLSYSSWLNQSDSREKSVYSVLPSNAVKGAANQAMLVSQAPMMRALDAISRVPWRINRFMLHVQEAIVREGFGFGKIRPGFYPLHYCAKKPGDIVHDTGATGSALSMTGGSAAAAAKRQSRGKTSAAADDDDDDDGTPVYNLMQRREYAKQQTEDWRNLSDLRSSRVHYLQALRQARSLVQFSHLYFPHSMDFRGRMYPLPGRLNHTGSDPFRALLEYADPKPLGAVGLYWLKVHLANKMGQSKLSFDERVQYVDEHITDVVRSAEAPLSGDKWWQEAAEPLQCLMACKELADALKCSQGPEAFLSRLPVAVDGSYNGLQHYSAIGRDEFGAQLVNLVPSERPADAYTGILKEMMKTIERDARQDNQVAQRCIGTGKGLDRNHIKRKTIKRPIMTQVYGVTGYGMSEQILEELVNQNRAHGLWTQTDMKEMAAYLREKVLESLGVTFKETQQCRKWLTQVTEMIWSAQPADLRNAFCWTTPLGLIVRQPYRVNRETNLFTAQGHARIASEAVAPASRKQLSAIAPNLIHSLDATHLAMTALEMQARGQSMMAVHDSYWTYACDLPELSQVLREQFVALYSGYDPLWELKEQWEDAFFLDLRRHGVRLPDPPQRGNLDLNIVLKSEYFFS